MRIRWSLLAMISCSAGAIEWPADLPWNADEAAPVDVQPFELPLLNGTAPHFDTPTAPLSPAPKIDPDSVFQAVIRCYPEKSQFKIDLELVAGVRSSIDEYSTDNWPEISEHYIGIVGKMPLYSTTEQARERQWEYQRRTATATTVAAFTQALANRNYAYRLMGLYMALEARSQTRVIKGVTGINEQVSLLEKVAASHKDVLLNEAKITESRLALTAMCEESLAEDMNRYLTRLAQLPAHKPDPIP